MNALKGLNLVAMPTTNVRDPKQQRRSKLVAQLEQQRMLALDPNFVVARHKWVKGENGDKQLVSVPKRVKRWWNEDGAGNRFFVVRYGSRPLALAAGKHAIAVGAKEKLVEVIDVVIDAARKGDLDEQLAAIQKAGQRPTVRAK